MKNTKKGFTLLELLVVLAILSILAGIGFGQYKRSQMKARDAQRKGDLDNVARALEMYYNDFQSYPASDTEGRIVIGESSLLWGGSFETDEAIYMKVLPEDPYDTLGDHQYCYEYNATDKYYYIYSFLENEQDSDYGTYTCAGNEDAYHYYVSSSNADPL